MQLGRHDRVIRLSQANSCKVTVIGGIRLDDESHARMAWLGDATGMYLTMISKSL